MQVEKKKEEEKEEEKREEKREEKKEEGIEEVTRVEDSGTERIKIAADYQSSSEVNLRGLNEKKQQDKVVPKICQIYLKDNVIHVRNSFI
jgi:hypothetical protein